MPECITITPDVNSVIGHLVLEIWRDPYGRIFIALLELYSFKHLDAMENMANLLLTPNSVPLEMLENGVFILEVNLFCLIRCQL